MCIAAEIIIVLHAAFTTWQSNFDCCAYRSASMYGCNHQLFSFQSTALLYCRFIFPVYKAIYSLISSSIRAIDEKR